MRRPAAGGVGVVSPVDATAAAVQEDPLFWAAVVVGALALAVVLGSVVRRLRRTTGERLLGALREQSAVAVLTHPNPDPDAMASALGVVELADAADADASIHYPGQIRHQENRAFQTVLDLDFQHVADVSDIPARAVVLVDHNEPRGFPGAETVDPWAVIDHHPGEGDGAALTDVRPEYGSCASILAEYFEELGWDPLSPDEDQNGAEKRLPSTVATGLVYGIQSDTKHLTNGCSPAEFSASAYLYDGVDEDRLDRIANPQVDAEVLEVKARAIRNRDVRNAFAVSDVGEVSNVDAIPQAADELVRLEGVTAVVVVGCKEGTMHLSGRSRDDRVHMGKTLRAVADEVPMASAGGHARMGGGQLSLVHMEGLGPGDGVDRAGVTDRLFDAMAGDV
ncbi:RNA-binding protein [Halobacteriales archaeon QH_10_67_22]|nr:MAG: RNA-binding protein [Halobacteriales archaeon QH_10_67_22]